MQNNHDYHGHSGDLGDIIYALPAIRESGIDKLVLYPRHDGACRLPMTEARANLIIPLLRSACPYLSSVSWTRHDRMTPLNDFRNKMRGNITDWHYHALGFIPDPCPPKWLHLPTSTRVAPVILSRSARYHNEAFPWRKIVETFEGRSVFVGTREEHTAFVEDFCEGIEMPHHICLDLLDLAEVLNGCELFVGNQSCPLAIAEGLKVKRIIAECWPDDANCSHKRLGRQNWMEGDIDLDFKRKKITVVSIGDLAIAPIVDLSFPNKRQYCQRHGYYFVFSDLAGEDKAIPASYYKIKLLLREMSPKERDGEWFFWTDADSVVLNMDVPLENFIEGTDADLIITHDNCGINCGQFFIRNSEASRAFLQRVWAMREQYASHKWWEQGAVQHLIRTGQHGLKIKLMPQKAFNQYPQFVQPGQPAPFIMHYPALELKKRCEMMKGHLQLAGLMKEE